MEYIPESMISELASWNDDQGIGLSTWTACTGNFSLAVGYSEIFWPRFVVFENTFSWRASIWKVCVPSNEIPKQRVSPSNG